MALTGILGLENALPKESLFQLLGREKKENDAFVYNLSI